MTTNMFLILFILPFAVMAISMLVLNKVLPASHGDDRRTGRLANYDDFHREAYIGAILAAVVAIIAFEIRGGPEPFVLIWLPLLSTVIILPLGYAAALIIGGMLGMTRQN